MHKILPRWSRKLRVCHDVGARKGEWFDASKPGKLESAVRRLIVPGRTYKAFVKRYGPGKYDREGGNAALTGDYSNVYVFLSLDDWIFSPKPDRQLFGNSVSVAVERKEVEAIPSVQWMTNAFARLCESMDFIYGFAYCQGEYDSKNMDLTRGFRAIGLDPSRYLPGLYWINFFGKPYVNLIGKKRLMTTPGAVIKELPAGVLIQFGTEPLAWSTRKYREIMAKALDHIGRQYFFDRKNRKHRTAAPKFILESIERDKGRL